MKYAKTGIVALIALSFSIMLFALAGCGNQAATTDNGQAHGGSTGTQTQSGATTGTAANGQALFESKCGTCHPLSTSTNAAYGKGEWKTVVDRMKAKTGAISDEDAAAITTYLDENVAK